MIQNYGTTVKLVGLDMTVGIDDTTLQVTGLLSPARVILSTTTSSADFFAIWRAGGYAWASHAAAPGGSIINLVPANTDVPDATILMGRLA